MQILAINPGSTSTKIAVYTDEKPLLVTTLRHSVEELAPFPRIIDQFEFRKEPFVVMPTLWRPSTWSSPMRQPV